MRIGFYPKLGWEGIRKNKTLYFPYILTGCIMVMMYYILSSLIEAPSLAEMPGGSSIMMVLPLGCIVIAVFSLLFLFYTNSFLIKQRYREFGLYNILGMNKRNICRIMIWESLFVAIIAIGIGLLAGIAFSKAAELILLNLLNMEITFDLRIGIKSIYQTPMIYGGIYLVLLCYSLIKVGRFKPLEMVQSNKVGERVLKRTWIFALAGILCLVFAYNLAVSIDEPLTALFWFFIAVLFVIFGTYLIFIAGSVVFCRLLQKNKKYYYQPNHFVSVSSMVYRMKRNGAGLASICILLTMVLVMISSTTSLYFGAENTLKNRYPNNVNITVTYDELKYISDENVNSLRNEIYEYGDDNMVFMEVRAAEIPGLITEDGVLIDYQNVSNFTTSMYDNIGYVSAISLEDYNQMMGEQKVLEEQECLIYSERLNYQWKTFSVEYGQTWQVKEQLDIFKMDGDASAMVMPTVYLVVEDLEAFAEPIKDMKNTSGDSVMVYDWRCGIDVESEETEHEVTKETYELISGQAKGENSSILSFSVRSREEQREGFYDIYGSLFFLGIMLSVVFLLAAVLIIYYKQISEGYEDQSRFDIMQKVGMTKRDIRRSINSQMLTVFFLPLLLAGVHLAFAFPFITKIFRMFAFDNTGLAIGVNVACFIVFGIFYAVVYKITSNVYYSIVSGRK